MIAAPNENRVAVLDDDIKFIRLVERVLRDEHIDVLPITTLDLEEAARIVAESGCLAALVDIYMYGDAAGFTLIEKLRAHPATAHLPLIVTSGAHREVGRKVSFLVEHNCMVLLKPFEVADLIAKVHGASAPAANVHGASARTAKGNRRYRVIAPAKAAE